MKNPLSNPVADPALTPENHDTRFRRADIDAASCQFDADLDRQINGTLPAGHIYKLGHPNGILLSAGLPDLSIEMAASRLSGKSAQENHPFELSALKGLVCAIHEPLGVFRSATRVGAFTVLTEIRHVGENFIAAIEANYSKGSIRVNDIRSLYPKKTSSVFGWINDGLLEYADKTRLPDWISQQRSNSAEVGNQARQAVAAVKAFENNPVPDSANSMASGGANVNGLSSMLKRTGCILCVVCAFWATADARADDSNVLNRVRSGLAGLTSVRATYTQEKELSLFKRKLVIKGRLLLDDKGALLWITDEPVRSALTIRGDTLRQWDGESGRVSSLPIKRIPALPALMGQLQSWFRGDVDTLTRDYDVRVEAESPPVLACVPKSKTAAPFSSVALTLNEKPLHIRQVELVETNGDRMTLRFERVELNGPVEDSDWTLPPKPHD